MDSCSWAGSLGVWNAGGNVIGQFACLLLLLADGFHRQHLPRLFAHPPAPPRSSGHFYSNPSNWMWRILRDTGIAPAAAIRGAQDDGRMPEVAGVVRKGQAGGQAPRVFEPARLLCGQLCHACSGTQAQSPQLHKTRSPFSCSRQCRASLTWAAATPAQTAPSSAQPTLQPGGQASLAGWKRRHGGPAPPSAAPAAAAARRRWWPSAARSSFRSCLLLAAVAAEAGRRRQWDQQQAALRAAQARQQWCQQYMQQLAQPPRHQQQAMQRQQAARQLAAVEVAARLSSSCWCCRRDGPQALALGGSGCCRRGGPCPSQLRCGAGGDRGD